MEETNISHQWIELYEAIPTFHFRSIKEFEFSFPVDERFYRANGTVVVQADDKDLLMIIYSYIENNERFNTSICMTLPVKIVTESLQHRVENNRVIVSATIGPESMTFVNE